MLNLELERSRGSKNLWFLKLNGSSVAVLVPSDIQKIVDLCMGVNGEAHYKADYISPLVAAHYGEEQEVRS